MLSDGSDFNIWNEHKFTDHRGPVAATDRVPRAALANAVAVAADETLHEVTEELRAVETTSANTTSLGEWATLASTLGEVRLHRNRFRQAKPRREIGLRTPHDDTCASITDAAVLAVVDDFSVSLAGDF